MKLEGVIFDCAMLGIWPFCIRVSSIVTEYDEHNRILNCFPNPSGDTRIDERGRKESDSTREVGIAIALAAIAFAPAPPAAPSANRYPAVRAP